MVEKSITFKIFNILNTIIDKMGETKVLAKLQKFVTPEKKIISDEVLDYIIDKVVNEFGIPKDLLFKKHSKHPNRIIAIGSVVYIVKQLGYKGKTLAKKFDVHINAISMYNKHIKDEMINENSNVKNKVDKILVASRTINKYREELWQQKTKANS